MATNTTQDAFLERFLASERTKRVIPYVYHKNVLDFGCGLKAWNANAITKYCRSIDGIEENYASPQKVGDVQVYSNLSQIPQERKYDVVLALAVFEHIDPFVLIDILHGLSLVCKRHGILVGTMPTPQARPILEFISYKLNLIDPSQIRDHKVYYDDLWFSAVLNQTEWSLSSYKQFQMGLNSHFVLKLK